jgi:hypothetical protein
MHKTNQIAVQDVYHRRLISIPTRKPDLAAMSIRV